MSSSTYEASSTSSALLATVMTRRPAPSRAAMRSAVCRALRLSGDGTTAAPIRANRLGRIRAYPLGATATAQVADPSSQVATLPGSARPIGPRRLEPTTSAIALRSSASCLRPAAADELSTAVYSAASGSRSSSRAPATVASAPTRTSRSNTGSMTALRGRSGYSHATTRRACSLWASTSASARASCAWSESS